MSDELNRCKDELQALKEENRHLREAAGSFGALAERLNGELREERRRNQADRRREARHTPDRRNVNTAI